MSPEKEFAPFVPEASDGWHQADLTVPRGLLSLPLSPHGDDINPGTCFPGGQAGSAAGQLRLKTSTCPSAPGRMNAGTDLSLHTGARECVPSRRRSPADPHHLPTGPQTTYAPVPEHTPNRKNRTHHDGDVGTQSCLPTLQHVPPHLRPPRPHACKETMKMTRGAVSVP